MVAISDLWANFTKSKDQKTKTTPTTSQNAPEPPKNAQDGQGVIQAPNNTQNATASQPSENTANLGTPAKPQTKSDSPLKLPTNVDELKALGGMVNQTMTDTTNKLNVAVEQLLETWVDENAIAQKYLVSRAGDQSNATPADNPNSDSAEQAIQTDNNLTDPNSHTDNTASEPSVSEPEPTIEIIPAGEPILDRQTDADIDDNTPANTIKRLNVETVDESLSVPTNIDLKTAGNHIIQQEKPLQPLPKIVRDTPLPAPQTNPFRQLQDETRHNQKLPTVQHALVENLDFGLFTFERYFAGESEPRLCGVLFLLDSGFGFKASTLNKLSALPFYQAQDPENPNKPPYSVYIIPPLKIDSQTSIYRLHNHILQALEISTVSQLVATTNSSKLLDKLGTQHQEFLNFMLDVFSVGNIVCGVTSPSEQKTFNDFAYQVLCLFASFDRHLSRDELYRLNQLYEYQLEKHHLQPTTHKVGDKIVYDCSLALYRNSLAPKENRLTLEVLKDLFFERYLRERLIDLDCYKRFYAVFTESHKVCHNLGFVFSPLSFESYFFMTAFIQFIKPKTVFLSTKGQFLQLLGDCYQVVTDDNFAYYTNHKVTLSQVNADTHKPDFSLGFCQNKIVYKPLQVGDRYYYLDTSCFILQSLKYAPYCIVVLDNTIPSFLPHLDEQQDELADLLNDLAGEYFIAKITQETQTIIYIQPHPYAEQFKTQSQTNESSLIQGYALKPQTDTADTNTPALTADTATATGADTNNQSGEQADNLPTTTADIADTQTDTATDLDFLKSAYNIADLTQKSKQAPALPTFILSGLKGEKGRPLPIATTDNRILHATDLGNLTLLELELGLTPTTSKNNAYYLAMEQFFLALLEKAYTNMLPDMATLLSQADEIANRENAVLSGGVNNTPLPVNELLKSDNAGSGVGTDTAGEQSTEQDKSENQDLDVVRYTDPTTNRVITDMDGLGENPEQALKPAEQDPLTNALPEQIGDDELNALLDLSKDQKGVHTPAPVLEKESENKSDDNSDLLNDLDLASFGGSFNTAEVDTFFDYDDDY